MEKEEYKKLHRLENKNWYFASRRLFFSKVLERFFSGKKGMKILDVGCGSGQMFKMLSRYGKVVGIDPSLYVLGLAPPKMLKVCGAGERLPFKYGKFDLITAFGVLEHIEDETGALRQLKQLVRKNGSILIEVPAYQFLWGMHDEALHHKRRYTISELSVKISRAGFRVKKATYIFGAILPFVIVLRLFKKSLGKKEIKSDEFDKLPFLLERILSLINRFEAQFAKRFYVPFGVSMVVLAKRQR